MGNAVMDLEWDIPFSFLSEQSLEKGLMTLVDQEQQEKLLQQSDNPYQHCGGSAANTLIAMAHLGSNTFFNCKVATDPMGELYLKNLNQYGIQGPPPSHFSLPTATCLVMITPDADRTMQTHLGIASELAPEDVLPGELAASDHLFIEGYLASSPKGQQAAVKAMKFAHDHDIKTILSLSDPSMAKYFRQELLEIIDNQKLNFLLCNADEALLFTQQNALPQALEKLSTMATNVAVTCGEKGVLIRENGSEWSVPTPDVKAINTNGAGDVFAGTYLYALTQGYPPEQSGAFACSAASLLVTRPGSRLMEQELQELYHKFFL